MAPLRQKMIDALLLHGFAERTQSSYLYAVFHLATHYRPSPETLTAEHIQDYFLYLIKDRKHLDSECHMLHLLGHKDLQSTLHYVHWSPTLPQGAGVDLLSGGAG